MNKKFSFMAAPMDGVIDSPMRQLIRQFSPKELLFGEMRHASYVAHNSAEIKSLQYNKIEQPIVFQISANTIDSIDLAVPKILERKFAMLNLNAGCPAKNVIKSGSGSALMSNPNLLKDILERLHKRLQNRVPLTLKIRAGFKEKNGLDIAKLAQDCGVEELIIHPRTQTQGFSGQLDFDIVKKIKKNLSIPIVFSGEIRSYKDAKETYEKTGVDRFMIGRALWGAPWKLKEIACEMEKKSFNISRREIIELAIKHLDMCVEFYGPDGVKSFKIHLAQYLRGFENASTMRRELLTIKTHKKMSSKLKALIKNDQKG